MQARDDFLREGNRWDALKIEAACASGKLQDAWRTRLLNTLTSSAELERPALFLEANRLPDPGYISTISPEDFKSLSSFWTLVKSYHLQVLMYFSTKQYLDGFFLLEEGEECKKALASHPGCCSDSEEKTNNSFLHNVYALWYNCLAKHTEVTQDPAQLLAWGARVLQRYDVTHQKAYGEASDVARVCTICLDEKVGSGDVPPGLWILSECRHSFHAACYIRYSQGADHMGSIKCPCCRAQNARPPWEIGVDIPVPGREQLLS